MSTNDVPGAKSSNNDQLAMGCWAEHEDGSLIFVQSTEGGRVVYMMFDTFTDPITEYRDAMPEKGFKDHFSYKSSKDIKWTWHDKTPFPWERVIKAGARDGVHHTSAHDTLRAAQKIARSLNLPGYDFVKEKYEHMKDSEEPLRNRIIDKVQNAISKLRT